MLWSSSITFGTFVCSVIGLLGCESCEDCIVMARLSITLALLVNLLRWKSCHRSWFTNWSLVRNIFTLWLKHSTHWKSCGESICRLKFAAVNCCRSMWHNGQISHFPWISRRWVKTSRFEVNNRLHSEQEHTCGFRLCSSHKSAVVQKGCSIPHFGHSLWSFRSSLFLFQIWGKGKQGGP